jgi:hypothetical protein
VNPAGSTLSVVFRKYDGSLHWHYPMTVLGEDEHGIWLGAPTGTPLRKGDGPARPAPGGFITLAGAGAWSMPIWNTVGRWASYVDICSPVEVTGGRVEAVDLDLDVVATWEGAVSVLDEDELTEHTALFGYPPEIVERARLEADVVRRRMEAGIEPFATAGARWLDLLGDDPPPPRPDLQSFDQEHLEER